MLAYFVVTLLILAANWLHWVRLLHFDRLPLLTKKTLAHFLTFPWQQQTLHTRGARGLQLKQSSVLERPVLLLVPLIFQQFVFLNPTSRFIFPGCSALCLLKNTYLPQVLLSFIHWKHTHLPPGSHRQLKLPQRAHCSLGQWAPRAHMALTNMRLISALNFKKHAITHYSMEP